MSIPGEYGANPSVIGKMRLGSQYQQKSLDISKRNNLCTTQFIMESQHGNFSMGLYLEQQFAPDICIGALEMPLSELIKDSGHRGPIVRQMPLTGSELEKAPGEINQQAAIMRFDLTLF